MDRRFDKHECVNLSYALKQEWLETNGLGGFACGNIVGCNTRKYHSLLTATTDKGKRFNFLSKVDDCLRINKESYYLNISKYLDVSYSDNCKYLENVNIGIFPCFTFKIHNRLIQKSILLLHDANTVLIRYDLIEGEDTLLYLRPLLSYKELHCVSKENNFIEVRTSVLGNKKGYKLSPYWGLPSFYMNVNDGTDGTQYYPGPDWYKNFEYQVERERGYDYVEDLFCPGVFETKLKVNSPVIFSFSLSEVVSSEIDSLFENEMSSRIEKLAQCRKNSSSDMEAMLRYKASDFIIKNYKGEKSIIAGYPWFEEWGRDTFIALRGLTIANNREEDALDIIKAYANYEKDGLIPNYLCGGDVSYNSVDAGLLFFVAIQDYVKKTLNYEKIYLDLAPTMKRMLSAYFSGRVPYVHLDSNGLLWSGNSSTQLTWMDAVAWGRPVTPRYGYAIEINALWYNALCFYLEMLSKNGVEPDQDILKIKDACKINFVKEFWNYERSCLCDAVNDQGKDRSIRPNQLFAVSLDYSPLTKEQQKGVLNAVSDCLLTPFGLRTLDPKDPRYCPYYRGNQDQRDSQYHQGTVWPWLIGIYVESVFKVEPQNAATVKKIEKMFFPLFEKHLLEYGVWSISEIMDGEYPHTPDGCFAQAWSVGELIRVLDFLKRYNI